MLTHRPSGTQKPVSPCWIPHLPASGSQKPVNIESACVESPPSSICQPGTSHNAVTCVEYPTVQHLTARNQLRCSKPMLNLPHSGICQEPASMQSACAKSPTFQHLPARNQPVYSQPMLNPPPSSICQPRTIPCWISHLSDRNQPVYSQPTLNLTPSTICQAQIYATVSISWVQTEDGVSTCLISMWFMTRNTRIASQTWPNVSSYYALNL